jgi:hypothetical protein
MFYPFWFIEAFRFQAREAPPFPALRFRLSILDGPEFLRPLNWPLPVRCRFPAAREILSPCLPGSLLKK